MKQRAEKRNVHEELARARKVARLVLIIEESAERLKTDPVELSHRLTDELWNTIAVQAGHRPPSNETRDAVMAMLVERARRSA